MKIGYSKTQFLSTDADDSPGHTEFTAIDHTQYEDPAELAAAVVAPVSAAYTIAFDRGDDLHVMPTGFISGIVGDEPEDHVIMELWQFHLEGAREAFPAEPTV